MVRYKYCPRCGSKVELKRDYYLCTSCKYKVYLHSYPTGSILPVENGKVLLSKRAINPHRGKLDVIGGFLKEGEHPKYGAAREAREETGLDIKPTRLLGIYMDEYEYQGEKIKTLNTFYVGEIMKGKMKATDDISELIWIPINSRPENLAFKCVYEALEDLEQLSRGERSRTPAA